MITKEIELLSKYYLYICPRCKKRIIVGIWALTGLFDPCSCNQSSELEGKS